MAAHGDGERVEGGGGVGAPRASVVLLGGLADVVSAPEAGAPAGGRGGARGGGAGRGVGGSGRAVGRAGLAAEARVPAHGEAGEYSVGVGGGRVCVGVGSGDVVAKRSRAGDLPREARDVDARAAPRVAHGVRDGGTDVVDGRVSGNGHRRDAA